jgi:hypothetical protein
MYLLRSGLSEERILFLRSVLRFLVNAIFVPSSPSFVTLMMEAICSSETSVLTWATQRNMPEGGVLYQYLVFAAFIISVCWLIALWAQWWQAIDKQFGAPPHGVTSQKTSFFLSEYKSERIHFVNIKGIRERRRVLMVAGKVGQWFSNIWVPRLEHSYFYLRLSEL